MLARLPGGVVLVGTRVGGGFHGLTATTFTPVSLQPPLVLVCLDRLAIARDAILAQGSFTASLLSRSQHFLADRFAGRAPVAEPSWRDVPHRLGDNGLPIVGVPMIERVVGRDGGRRRPRRAARPLGAELLGAGANLER